MSNSPEQENEINKGEQKNIGPNLVLVYTLMALAFLAAVAIAAAIVWPFYLRR